jgi:hypothetical protein
LGVGDAGFLGGLGEVFVFGQDGVGVGFDEVDFVVGGNAEVEAGVAVDGEEVVDAFAGFLDGGDEGGVEVFGELVFEAPFFAVVFVPFGFVGGHFGFVGRDFAEDEFADGVGFEAVVAEEADVEFAAFDVFFGDDVVVVGLVDELDALVELVVVLDEGGLGDAEGGFFFEGFDDDGEFEAFGAGDVFAAVDGDEFGGVDAVVAEDFFGDGFVFAEGESAGAAAGEGDAVHGEVGDDVLVEGAVVFELVGEVEDEVGLEFLEFLLDEVEVVEDGEVFGGVAELGEGGEDVAFGFAVVGLEVFGEVLVEGGGGAGVEEGEDFEFRFHFVGKFLNRDGRFGEFFGGSATRFQTLFLFSPACRLEIGDTAGSETCATGELLLSVVG